MARVDGAPPRSPASEGARGTRPPESPAERRVRCRDTSDRLCATMSSRTPIASEGSRSPPNLSPGSRLRTRSPRSPAVVAAQTALPVFPDLDLRHLLQHVLAKCARRRHVAHDTAADDERLQQPLGRTAIETRRRRLVRRQHHVLHGARQTPDLLRSRSLAALGHGPSLDLHDIEGERQHRAHWRSRCRRRNRPPAGSASGSRTRRSLPTRGSSRARSPGCPAPTALPTGSGRNPRAVTTACPAARHRGPCPAPGRPGWPRTSRPGACR